MDEHVGIPAHDNNSSGDGQPSARPPISPVPNPPAIDSDYRREKMSKTDKIMVVATIFIAIGTLVSAGAICFQWYEMHAGGRDTSTIASASERNAKAAEGFAASAAGINTKLDSAVGKLNDQAGATHDLAVAAGKQADASKALADLTAKQFAASQELIESQGASISVSFGQVINPITFHEGAPSIVFSVLLQNTGAIKATHVAVRFKPYYSLWGNNIFNEPLQKQRDFCAIPAPPTPEWGWQDGKRINLKGLRDWTVTIEPHTPFERQLNFGMAKPADAEIIKWPPADVIQSNPTLPVSDRIFPMVVGCVDYQSGAMPEKHQTGFIFEVQEVYSDPSVPNAAPTLIHYGIDLPAQRVMITPFYFGQGKSY